MLAENATSTYGKTTRVGVTILIETAESIAIESQEDAWEVLQRLMDGKINVDETSINFSQASWVNFHLNYKGSGFNQTLTPSVMAGIVEYQRHLYQVIALLTKGDPKVSRLTDDEKDSFELVFKVSEGSTDLFAKAQEIIDGIGGKVFDNMTSTHKMICVIVVALLFFGHYGFSTYLENNLELKKIESQTDRDKQLTDIIRQLTPGAEEKAKVLEKATQMAPQVEEIRGKANEAYEEIVRSAGSVDSLSVQGVSVGSETITALTQITRRQAKKITLKGLFTVSNVDTKVAGGFMVRFEKVGGDLVITANLADALLAERYKKVIERATFNKRAIRVTIAARQVGDSYLDARVLKAATPRK